MLVTVTGSTGTIGGELVRLLSETGVSTRAVFRNPKKIKALPHVAWIQADLGDVDLLEPVIAGTTRLFLLSDNQPGFGRIQINALKAAERLGVEHVVKLSALGASDHSKSSIAREHWEVEQAIEQSTLSWTLLRPHSFMQNWLGDVASTVRTEGIIYSPIGDARVPFIDTRDIADVAREALLHPEAHSGRKYVLTGGEAVSFIDVAEALSKQLNRTITYRPISLDDARERLEQSRTPGVLIDAMLAILAYQRAGGPTSLVSDKVEKILGRPPRTITEFVRDYADQFESA